MTKQPKLPKLTNHEIEHLTNRATRTAALAHLDAAHGSDIAEKLAKKHPAKRLNTK